MRIEALGLPLTKEEAVQINDLRERTFALACIKVGCEVYSQIPVGNSRIDFFVINPKNDRGKLVEITYESREDIYKKNLTVIKKGRKKRVPNNTGLRKQRQIESMKASGLPWTILCRDEMQKIENFCRTDLD
jgi:hypothetical protein